MKQAKNDNNSTYSKTHKNDIFAAIPEVAALIALVDSLFSNDDDIILIVTGVWCSTALIPLCVAIIYYKWSYVKI